jgi:hypothetical protein
MVLATRRHRLRCMGIPTPTITTHTVGTTIAAITIAARASLLWI